MIDAGHHVIGLARSNESAKAIGDAGGEVLMGTLDDLETLEQGALHADGIIHTAFSTILHDMLKRTNAIKQRSMRWRNH